MDDGKGAVPPIGLRPTFRTAKLRIYLRLLICGYGNFRPLFYDFRFFNGFFRLIDAFLTYLFRHEK